jgi:hypothetical protein
MTTDPSPVPDAAEGDYIEQHTDAVAGADEVGAPDLDTADVLEANEADVHDQRMDG